MKSAIADLLAPLAEADEIVFFSGAGLSADSGIPTFRDGATGLWANVDPMEAASIDGFESTPDKVWDWHRAMRALFAGTTPNAGHVGIAAFEGLLPQARITVITQNIDGLHQAAGSTRVLEVHGSALRLRCHRHCGFVDAWDGKVEPACCPICGAPVRPDVVWFGEALDETVFAAAGEAASTADVLFTVGTSAVIQPAAGLPMLARQNGALIVEVNPHATPFSGFANHSLRAGASAFFTELARALSARH